MNDLILIGLGIYIAGIMLCSKVMYRAYMLNEKEIDLETRIFGRYVSTLLSIVWPLTYIVTVIMNITSIRRKKK